MHYAQPSGAGSASRCACSLVPSRTSAPTSPSPSTRSTTTSGTRSSELNLSSCMPPATRTRARDEGTEVGPKHLHLVDHDPPAPPAAETPTQRRRPRLPGLARAAASDLGPFGITVNCIAPGPFLTDLPVRFSIRSSRDDLASRTALGRWGQPDELIGPALLLASDAWQRRLTGTRLTVDARAAW